MATDDLSQLSKLRGLLSSAALLQRHFEGILDRCLTYSEVTAWTAASVSKSVFEVLLRECSICAWRLHNVIVGTILAVVLPRAKPTKDSPEDLAHNYVRRLILTAIKH